jgi:hypothetical protein
MLSFSRNRRAIFASTLALCTLAFLLIVEPLNAASYHTTAAGQPGSGSQQDPALIGSWGNPIQLGTIAIHASLLHTNQVLVWWYPLGTKVNSPARLIDLATGNITDVTIPFPGDFFCSGLTNLADGRVLVTGGLEGNPYPGVPDKGIALTAIFDPIAKTWSQGANMLNARWYPSNIELNNGTVLAVTGKDATATHIVTQMEVYNYKTNTWTALPSSANIPPTSDTYLKLKLLPSGKLFMAGSNSKTMLFSSATNRWVPMGTLNFGNRYHGAAVLLPGFGLQRVLTAGGTQSFPGGGATATAEMIDFSQATPQWQYVAPMSIPRYNANLVILADGTLLEVGGAQTKKYSSPVLVPELYDPVANTWTQMATEPSPRTYHSTALLLPDGTVFAGGSDDPANRTVDLQYEIFSPPYLFKGARPTITAAPTALTYNQQFTITTPDAASITRVAMIRPSAVTHDNDFDQRYVDLAFTVGSGQITATAPLNANNAPQGYYMLVIVNSSGVPSVMPFVQIM